ncbi:MAG: archease [Dehalococcoidia bacterium]|nr:MAG: archease [Dehalococcoidia bacterium]
MKRFRLIEHTADTGLIAYGSSLAEAFGNAAYGLFSIIAELDRVRETESLPVIVSAEDSEELLFEWLNHLIYIFEVKHLLLKKFDITKFTEHGLEAVCWGERYDSSRHQLKIGVKSTTYHMLEINREKNTVRVIFDV